MVEDGATFGGLLVALLRAEGYQAMRVWQAREVAKIARDRRPDLVIAELSLPYVDEVEIVEILLRSSELAGKPLLVVTSHPLPKLKGRAGITEIVEKPYDIDKMLNAVRRALGEPEVEVPEKNYDLQDSYLHGW